MPFIANHAKLHLEQEMERVLHKSSKKWEASHDFFAFHARTIDQTSAHNSQFEYSRSKRFSAKL